MIGLGVLTETKGRLCQLREPAEQAAEAHLVEVDAAAAAPWMREHFPMPPHPLVAQDQRQAHEQQPQQRIARAGDNARLTQLPVGGFDTKAEPVRREYPLSRGRL